MKILNKIKNYKNYLYYYNNSLGRMFMQNFLLKYSSLGIEYPIFLYRVTLFKLNGIISKLHKKNINNSVTIKSLISNSKIKLNFPFNYGLIKFN